MPKRVGHLYETMCDKDLIREAIRKGSKHKKKRWDVKLVLRAGRFIIPQKRQR